MLRERTPLSGRRGNIMEIEYRLSESDILAFMKFQIARRKGWRNPVLFRQIAYLVSFILIGLGAWLFSRELVLPLAFLLLAILCFVLYPMFFDWALRRRVTAAYHDPAKKASLASRVLRVSPEGLEEISDLGEIKVKWEAVNDLVVTPSHMFISVQGTSSIVIPIQYVDKGNYQEFVNVCREHVERNAA
jgi:hypothetical protein